MYLLSIIFSIDEPYGEWSPDVINDVTRVPDQISLENHTESHRNEVDDQGLSPSFGFFVNF